MDNQSLLMPVKLPVHLCMHTNTRTRNARLPEHIKSLLIHHISKGRGASRTHIELKFVCPLPNQTVARIAGVCGLVLKDVITARCIPILVKYHWGASAT